MKIVHLCYAALGFAVARWIFKREPMPLADPVTRFRLLWLAVGCLLFMGVRRPVCAWLLRPARPCFIACAKVLRPTCASPR
jgi:hypothetical protein